MADRYASMTTAQLEQEAAARTPPVDLAGATTNAQRADALRAADARAAVQPGVGDQPAGSSTPLAHPGNTATGTADAVQATPYPSDADVANRLGAARGEPVVEDQTPPPHS